MPGLGLAVTLPEALLELLHQREPARPLLQCWWQRRAHGAPEGLLAEPGALGAFGEYLNPATCSHAAALRVLAGLQAGGQFPGGWGRVCLCVSQLERSRMCCVHWVNDEPCAL